MKQILIILLIVISQLKSNAAMAAEQNTILLKTFDDWQVMYKIDKDDIKHCIVIAAAAHSVGFIGFRETPKAMFSYIKKNKSFTFSMDVGFVINQMEVIKVMIGNKVFYLKPYRDFFAYTYNNEDDQELIFALLQDRKMMRIRTVSQELIVVNDYYNFKSIDKAFNFIKLNSNCN